MANKQFGHKISKEDLKEWKWSDCTDVTDEQFWQIIDQVNNNGVNLTLKPEMDGPDTVFVLSCFYPVEILTAAKEVASKDIRLWLNKHGLRHIPLFSTDGVANAAQAKLERGYSIYIDDNPRFVGKMPKDQYLILYDQPWNRNVTPNGVNEYRAHTWNEALLLCHQIQNLL